MMRNKLIDDAEMVQTRWWVYFIDARRVYCFTDINIKIILLVHVFSAREALYYYISLKRFSCKISSWLRMVDCEKKNSAPSNNFKNSKAS